MGTNTVTLGTYLCYQESNNLLISTSAIDYNKTSKNESSKIENKMNQTKKMKKCSNNYNNNNGHQFLINSRILQLLVLLSLVCYYHDNLFIFHVSSLSIDDDVNILNDDVINRQLLRQGSSRSTLELLEEKGA